MDILAYNIKEYRKSKKLTQKDLAVLLDVAPTAISAWEVGRNKPLMDKIEQMAQIFNIKKSELLGETTPTTAPNSLVEQISDKVVQLTEPNQ
ncbi:helix-turn-helix transcriptional regulator, partial [Streptococcus suis]|nr:helix-turn-helix transcriptional regulator [Streptococcus suis]